MNPGKGASCSSTLNLLLSLGREGRREGSREGEGGGYLENNINKTFPAKLFILF